MAKKGAESLDVMEQSLPPLDDGEWAEVVSLELVARKTTPPSRYTEGTLLDDMRGAAKYVEDNPALKKQLKEVSGLGTAATRDSVIEALKAHKYIEKSGKHLIATEKGVKFIQWLEQVYPPAIDVALTAQWEAELAIVAVSGGGKSFEARIANQVREMVERFKTAPAMVLSTSTSTTTTSKGHTMSENESTGRSNRPSDKMLEFAKSIATRLGVRVPDEVMTDWDACKAFIDENKDTAMRPSEKQLNFANSIASSKGLTIPAEVLANGRELSKWIDKHK